MLQRFFSAVFAAGMILFLIGPVLAILPLGFNSGAFLTYPMDGGSWRWYAEIASTNSWLHAIANSLKIGVTATLLATLLGTIAAFGLRGMDLPFIGVVKTLFLLPMVVPAVVLGVGMQIVFSKTGLANSFLGVVIAHTIVCIPFVLINVLAALNSVDPALEKAASSLGAHPIRVFFTVVFPLILPGVLVGAVFAFAISLDEVVITMFVAGPQQWTLALQIFSSLRENISPAVIAAATLLIGAMLVVMFIALGVKRSKSKMKANG